MYRKYFLGAQFFNTIYNRRKLEFLFLPPYHYIIFFPCSFIYAAILNLKSFSLIKRYGRYIFLIYTQKQFAPYILYIIQQNFANAHS